MMPFISGRCRVGSRGRRPNVSTGTLNASQVRTRREPFRFGVDVQGACSCIGWLAHDPDRAALDATESITMLGARVGLQELPVVRHMLMTVLIV